MGKLISKSQTVKGVQVRIKVVWLLHCGTNGIELHKLLYNHYIIFVSSLSDEISSHKEDFFKRKLEENADKPE